jgi:hypothetical protein
MDAAFQAVAQTVQALDDGFKALTEDLRQVSPSLAVSGVEVELLHLGGRLRQDAEIGGDLAEVEIQRAQIEEDIREIKTDFIKVLLPLIQAVLTIGESIFLILGPILRGLSKVILLVENMIMWTIKRNPVVMGWTAMMGLLKELVRGKDEELDLDEELRIFFSKADVMKEFEESAKIR